MNQQKTLSQLASELNALVSGLTIRGDHNNFHNAVRDAVQGALTGNLRCGIWRISADNWNLMEYDRDFVEDGRSSRLSKGKFDNVRFTVSQDLNPEMTIDEATKECKRRHIQTNIAIAQGEIAGLQDRIKNQEEYIEHLHDQLNKL